jgi:hypothetical protein
LLFEDGVAIKSQHPFGEPPEQLVGRNSACDDAQSKVNEISPLHLVVAPRRLLRQHLLVISPKCLGANTLLQQRDHDACRHDRIMVARAIYSSGWMRTMMPS